MKIIGIDPGGAVCNEFVGHPFHRDLLQGFMIGLRMIGRMDRIKVYGPCTTRSEGKNIAIMQTVESIQQKDGLERFTGFNGKFKGAIVKSGQWSVCHVKGSFRKNHDGDSFCKHLAEIRETPCPVLSTGAVHRHHTKTV